MAAMSIAAANVGPDLGLRRQITAQDLRRLQEPAVIREGSFRDDDGAPFFVFTVVGFLDGENVASMNGGVTVGGDAIVIHADSQDEADAIAGQGLQDTIDALNAEEGVMLDRLAAKARLESVGPLRRLELATATEKNPEFVADAAAIEPLRGDDLLMAAGGVEH